MKGFYTTFKGYFSQRFVAISDNLKECMKIFQMHLPSNMMSKWVIDLFNRCSSLLDFHWHCICNSSEKDFEKVYRCCVKTVNEDGYEAAGICFEMHQSIDQKDVFELTSLTIDEICKRWRQTSSRSVLDILSSRLTCLEVVSCLQTVLKIPKKAGKHRIKDFWFANATLILCTASSSFRLRWVRIMPPMELVIIDEAAQLKAFESLIPMQIFGLRHAVL